MLRKSKSETISASKLIKNQPYTKANLNSEVKVFEQPESEEGAKNEGVKWHSNT